MKDSATEAPWVSVSMLVLIVALFAAIERKGILELKNTNLIAGNTNNGDEFGGHFVKEV